MSNLPAERPPLQPAAADGPVWERLKGESGAAYNNFIAYRNQTRGQHSLARAAKELGKNVGTLKDQSVRYRWQERVDAYDDYLDRRDREMRESEREALNRRGVQMAHQLLGLGMTRIVGRPRRGQEPAVQPANPNDLTATDAARVMEIGWRMGRLATGQATDTLGRTDAFSADDVRKIVNGLYMIGLRLLPQERHGRWASEIQAFLDTGRAAA